MKNLSDGEKDGFTLFYLKDKKLNSVILSKEQAEMLDIVLDGVFKAGGVKIIKCNDKIMKGYL